VYDASSALEEGAIMAGETKERHARLALLIDADNVRGDFVPIIVREASALGTVTVKRVYGHFASSSMNAWHPLVHEHALTPVHIPPAVSGKNATDMKLAIEAMDLLHRGLVEGFCIASSDSDFTTLASRIREEGVAVYGFGEQKASTGWVRSCDRFFYCDLLLLEERQGSDTSVAPKKARIPVDDILAAIEDVSDEDGWANLGTVGQTINKRLPDFDPRNHGFKKLSDLVASIKPVEIKRTPSSGPVRVRAK
jgi:hypothetical protein